MQCTKNIAVENNKNGMSIANFVYIYIYIYKHIYIPILYVTRMTQNKNDSINSILQHSGVVNKNYCVVFPTSRFPYLTLCQRQCKWNVATTFLAIRTKNN